MSGVPSLFSSTIQDTDKLGNRKFTSKHKYVQKDVEIGKEGLGDIISKMKKDQAEAGPGAVRKYSLSNGAGAGKMKPNTKVGISGKRTVGGGRKKGVDIFALMDAAMETGPTEEAREKAAAEKAAMEAPIPPKKIVKKKVKAKSFSPTVASGNSPSAAPSVTKDSTEKEPAWKARLKQQQDATDKKDEEKVELVEVEELDEKNDVAKRTEESEGQGEKQTGHNDSRRKLDIFGLIDNAMESGPTDEAKEMAAAKKAAVDAPILAKPIRTKAKSFSPAVSSQNSSSSGLPSLFSSTRSSAQGDQEPAWKKRLKEAQSNTKKAQVTVESVPEPQQIERGVHEKVQHAPAELTKPEIAVDKTPIEDGDTGKAEPKKGADDDDFSVSISSVESDDSKSESGEEIQEVAAKQSGSLGNETSNHVDIAEIGASKSSAITPNDIASPVKISRSLQTKTGNTNVAVNAQPVLSTVKQDEVAGSQDDSTAQVDALESLQTKTGSASVAVSPEFAVSKVKQDEVAGSQDEVAGSQDDAAAPVDAPESLQTKTVSANVAVNVPPAVSTVKQNEAAGSQDDSAAPVDAPESLQTKAVSANVAVKLEPAVSKAKQDVAAMEVKSEPAPVHLTPSETPTGKTKMEMVDSKPIEDDSSDSNDEEDNYPSAFKFTATPKVVSKRLYDSDDSSSSSSEDEDVHAFKLGASSTTNVESLRLPPAVIDYNVDPDDDTRQYLLALIDSLYMRNTLTADSMREQIKEAEKRLQASELNHRVQKAELSKLVERKKESMTDVFEGRIDAHRRINAKQDRGFQKIMEEENKIVEALRKENKRLRGENNKLPRQINDLKHSIRDLEAANEEIQGHLESLGKFTKKLELDHERLQASNSKCRDEYLPRYRGELRERESYIETESRIKNLYRNCIIKVARHIGERKRPELSEAINEIVLETEASVNPKFNPKILVDNSSSSSDSDSSSDSSDSDSD